MLVEVTHKLLLKTVTLATILKIQHKAKRLAQVQPPSDSYYKQYFNSKTEAYGALEQGNVFTDIDAYTTTGSIDKDGYIVEQQTKEEDEYGAWGENSKDITINIYDHSPIVRWNRPYWWYGSGWGYSYNWCSPFWGIGYGWGYPYYGYYGWGYPYYYGGYYNNFYNPYYGNPYNGYAFSRGRRNSDYYSGRSSLRTDRYSMRDASRGVSIARTKNIRRSTNNITASSSTRVARRARTARNTPSKRYSRNVTNYSSRSNKNTRNNNNKIIKTQAKETLVITIQVVTPEVIQTLLLLKEALLLVDREQLLEEAVLPV